MSDLIITKKDEVFAHVRCERYIAKELSEYFSFFVPGYKFTPAYRNKLWDGKIKLFNQLNNQIYFGLVKYLEKFCDDSGYTWENQYDNEISNGGDDPDTFFQSLNLHTKGIKISPRSHQVEAYKKVMSDKRVLLLSPTSSGKSLIAYLIFRKLFSENLKGLIITPTTSLVSQMFTDFEDYSSNNNFNVDKNVHQIYEGREKQSNKKLIISTWQSLYKMPKSYFDQFDYVIIDEAHTMKADSIKGILEKCTKTKYRVGMTGTLDGTKCNKLVLEGLSGPVFKVISTKELIEKDEISNFKIKCLVLKHDDEICEGLKKATYQQEIDYIVNCEKRNNFIKNLALSTEKNTLILFNLVEKHGKNLYNMIKDSKKNNGRKIYFIFGGTETSERESIRKLVETESNAIIIASMGCFSTGINIRNLHNIIFASPTKSRIRTLQSIGRGLRKSINKETAVIFDISDDLRYKKHLNFTLKHFIERSKIYLEEKFNFKIINVKL